jgi:hypothetical protein
MNQKAFLDSCVVLTDLQQTRFDKLLVEVFNKLIVRKVLGISELSSIKKSCMQEGFNISDLGHGMLAVRVQHQGPGLLHSIMCQTRESIEIESYKVQCVWLIFGSATTEMPNDTWLQSFEDMLLNDHYNKKILGKHTEKEILGAFRSYHSEHPVQDLVELDFVSNNIADDFARRSAFYFKDFKDGLSFKSLGSIFFLFFACLAQSVAFGGLLALFTQDHIGTIETIVSVGGAGIFYALFAGQALSLCAVTGPLVVLIGIFYQLALKYGIPFLPFYSCIGMWAGIILMVFSMLRGARLIRYFTRFTEEIFACIIASIFIFEGVKDILNRFLAPGIAKDTALLSLILSLGTLFVTRGLVHAQRSTYLRASIRKLLSNFAVALAILSMSYFAHLFPEVHLNFIDMPQNFAPTIARAWFINPLQLAPSAILLSIVPACLVVILLFLNHGITMKLINNKNNKLLKGSSYHLDTFVLGMMISGLSLFGLPWLSGSIVVSLNHMRSLMKTKIVEGKEEILSVRENRITPLFINILLLSSLLFIKYLSLIPMSVLFGLFLFMGFGALHNNQFFDRLRLWVMDPDCYPPTHYMRRVPIKVVHKYTAIQFLMFVLLWFVKFSSWSLLFSAIIALLLPLRIVLKRFFEELHLNILDAEELPCDEEEQYLA